MNEPTNRPRGRPPTDQRPIVSAIPQPVDLATLVDEISRLNQRNEELVAAAGMWQSRARYLEEQLQQLPAIAGEAPGSLEPADTDDQHVEDGDVEQDAQRGIWTRLARWLGGTQGA